MFLLWESSVVLVCYLFSLRMFWLLIKLIGYFYYAECCVSPGTSAWHNERITEIHRYIHFIFACMLYVVSWLSFRLSFACLLFKHYLPLLCYRISGNTRQWTSLRVLSTPYAYVRKKTHHWKTAFSLDFFSELSTFSLDSWLFQGVHMLYHLG